MDSFIAEYKEAKYMSKSLYYPRCINYSAFAIWYMKLFHVSRAYAVAYIKALYYTN